MKPDKKKPVLKKPDWIPDWRDEQNYPDPADTTAQQWAWEFLRRNPKYQADYAEFVSCANEDFVKTLNDYVLCYKNKDFFITGILWDEAMLEEDEILFSWPRYQEISRDYNLILPIDPSTSGDIPYFLKYDFVLPTIKTIHSGPDINELNPDCYLSFTVMFDVSQPKKQQLQYIEGFFDGYRKKRAQSKKRQQQMQSYNNYLRIIDALLYEETKEKKIEVAQKIHGGTAEADLDALRKAYGTAKKLMTAGFRELSQTDRARDHGQYLAGKKFGESLAESLP